MSAYYNENDPFAAQWLRNLIAAGHIASGDVDERSIEEVRPDDIRKYTQCHFFAGIGVWSYALRRAGWSDDRPVWTGSCPCQPFSAAGKGGGFADERHLWPAWYHLIAECRPSIVFGEQVASKDGLGWLDLVQTDMEAAGYAFGAVDTCSAGSGAPHIRQRLRFVAQRVENTELPTRTRQQPVGRTRLLEQEAMRPAGAGLADRLDMSRTHSGVFHGEAVGGLEHAQSDGWQQRRAEPSGRGAVARRASGGLANAASRGGSSEREQCRGEHGLQQEDRGVVRSGYQGSQPGLTGRMEGPGPVNGYWRDADWLFCRDGKWRPVEPGTFPLAHGAPARVGRLRAYGNAVDAEATKDFIIAADQAMSRPAASMQPMVAQGELFA